MFLGGWRLEKREYKLSDVGPTVLQKRCYVEWALMLVKILLSSSHFFCRALIISYYTPLCYYITHYPHDTSFCTFSPTFKQGVPQLTSNKNFVIEVSLYLFSFLAYFLAVQRCTRSSGFLGGLQLCTFYNIDRGHSREQQPKSYTLHK